ncbi:MAG: hypothetical protein V1861_02775 [Candidatus Micrarchaeota archaeon]
MKETSHPAAQKARQRRSKDRKEAFKKAEVLHGTISKVSGASALGRDENGVQKETRDPSGFRGVVLVKWYVRLSFKHEDRNRLNGKSLAEVESVIKEGKEPRKRIPIETHIITAVRLLKHMRHSYEKEIRQSESLLQLLDKANMDLADRSTGCTDEGIQSVYCQLEAIKPELEKKEVAIKRIVTCARIAKTLDHLDTALSLPMGSERAMEVSRACAVLTSVRNRLGTWRSKQVAGISRYNLQKEYSLRAARDRWLYAAFTRLKEVMWPDYVHKSRDGKESSFKDWSAQDEARLAVLQQFERMLRSRKPKDTDKEAFTKAKLDYLAANHNLFRIEGRDNSDSEAQIRMCEEGITPKEHGRIDYLLGHYRQLYRFVRSGDTAKAKAKIDHLKTFVNANKPSFILGELEKEPDPYLVPVIEHLSRGILAYDNGDFRQAELRMSMCKDLIRRYAYPSDEVKG